MAPHPRTSSPPAWQVNLAWGIAGGASLALGYSLIALFMSAGGGQSAAARDWSLPHAIVSYWVGGLTAGAVVGLARPHLVTRWRTMLVVAIAPVPSMAVLTRGIAGYGAFTAGERVFGTLACAALIGGGLGWQLWTYVLQPPAAPDA